MTFKSWQTSQSGHPYANIQYTQRKHWWQTQVYCNIYQAPAHHHPMFSPGEIGRVSVPATELLYREWGSLESKVEQPSPTRHMVMVACYARQTVSNIIVRWYVLLALYSQPWTHTTCIMANNWCYTCILLHLGSVVWLYTSFSTNSIP